MKINMKNRSFSGKMAQQLVFFITPIFSKANPDMLYFLH